MKKLFQLVFGDARNIASVCLALAAAWLTWRMAPEASGWVLAIALMLAAAWQARR